MDWLRVLVCGCLVFLCLSSNLQAQAKPSTPEAQANQINEKLRDGDYQTAIPMLETFLTNNPTFDGYNGLVYNLAFSYYVTANYDKALARFKELLGPKNRDPELKAQASFTIPGVLAAQALTKRTPGDRDKLLQESVKLYDEFVKSNAKHRKVPDAFYNKAAALWQLNKLEDADKSLTDFFQAGTNSSLKHEATYLRARVYAGQAKKLRDEKKEAEAAKFLEQAKQMFDQVGNQRDLILANQAFTSAGEALLTSAAYPDGIRYLRKVKSQKFLEDQQRQKIKELQAAKIQATKAGNVALQNDTKEQIERAELTLKSLQTKTSLYLTAQELIARCFYEQKKFDEVLVLINHFLPHFDADQKKRSAYLVVKSYMGKNQLDKAIQDYTSFKSAHGKDKMIEDIPYGLADLYLKASKYDDCVKWVDEYLASYPGGLFEEHAYYLRMTAFTLKGDTQKAQAANEAFTKKFPTSTLAGSALFSKAYTNYQKKDFSAAVNDFREYLTRFPNTDSSENAAFLTMLSLFELKRYDESIKEFETIEKKYAAGKQFPNVLFQLGKTYEAKGDTTSANATYARIVKDLPSTEAAPIAQFRIGQNFYYKGAKSHPDAIAAFDAFIAKFPNHPDVPAAHYFKGEIARHGKNYDEAQKIYEEIAQRYPETAAAAEAAFTIGEMHHQRATSLANKPEKLSEEKQAEWKEAVQKAQSAYENVVRKFPKSASVDKALSQLSLLWQKRIAAKFTEKDESRAYFDKLGASFGSDPSMQVKVAFALGSLLNLLQDKDAALVILNKAFQKAADISLPNEGYKQYRSALLDGKQYDTAISVSEKQLKEKQAARDEQGVSEALLALGVCYFEKGDFTKAGQYLNETTSKYSWNENVINEALFYQAWVLEKNKKFDEARKAYEALRSKKTLTSFELKARCTWRLAYTWLEGKDVSTLTAGTVADNVFSEFSTLGTRYNFPELSSEGLYMTGQISEKGFIVKNIDSKTQAKTYFDQKTALEFYKKCIDRYPETAWAEKAKKRLGEIGK
jgi:outer membrane protein assembly factor BamD (BamD/ComL family)